MRINLKKLEDIGYRVEERDGTLDIYRDSGSNIMPDIEDFVDNHTSLTRSEKGALMDAIYAETADAQVWHDIRNT